MRRTHAYFLLIGLALSGSACTADAQPRGTVRRAPPIVAPAQPTPLEQRLLAVHNRVRALAGVPLLTWDRALAAGAAAYAPALAARGSLAHSPRASRPGIGENLWMGTAGAFSPEAMVASWAGERARFRPGIFPAVATTGNWLDVGHYTQMIWRGTTRLGCALHRAGRFDYLICRYSPAGNRDGQRVP